MSKMSCEYVFKLNINHNNCCLNPPKSHCSICYGFMCENHCTMCKRGDSDAVVCYDCLPKQSSAKNKGVSFIIHHKTLSNLDRSFFF